METRKYREDQIAKLRDLLRETTKAIQLGDTYYREANEAYQKSKSLCDKVEAASTNLGQILKEQDKQVQSAEQLVLQVRYSAKTISSAFAKLQSTEDELTKGLSLVFLKLSQRTIDPNISAKKTLYEFVDNESVDALKVQAQQEMRNIKALVNIGENILTTVEGQFNELSHLNEDSTLKFEYKPSFGTEKLSLQMNEINSMHAVLNTISSFHDKVNVIYNSRETTYVDITAYEHKDISEIAAQVAKMHDSLQRINENYKRIDAQMQQVNLAFKTVQKIVALVDKLVLDAKAKLTELSSLDATFEQHKHRLTLLFDELSSLVSWYEAFWTSYNELLHEIVRRKQESKRQQEVAEVYQRELNALWKSECDQREDFYEFYGKYLPQSLCPAIFEEPARYQILQENQTLPLPNVQFVRTSQMIVEDEMANLSLNKDT